MGRARQWWDVPDDWDITRAAKQVYRYIYREAWPKGWRVSWIIDRDFPNESHFLGVCYYGDKLIMLERQHAWQDSQIDALVLGSKWPMFFREYPEYWRIGGVIDTLLHEFVHMRGLRRHGREFRRRLDEAKRRLMRGCAPAVETRRAA